MYCHFEENYKYIFMYAYKRVQRLQYVASGNGMFFLGRSAALTLTQLVALKGVFFLQKVHKNFL